MAVKVSPSQLETYWDCPEKWRLIYVDGYRSKASKKTFDKGNYTHELMHVYYHLVQEGFVPGSDNILGAIHSRIQHDLRNVTADNVETYNSISKVMTTYVVGFSRKIDSLIKVLAVESEVLYDIETPAGRKITLQGIIDLLYRDKLKRLVVRDHKTTGNFGSWTQEKARVHGQLLMYATIVWKLTGEVPITEINCLDSTNYKRVEKRADQICKLLPVTHPETTLQKFWDVLMLQIDKMYDSPVVPHYSTKCVSCPFHDYCTLEMKGVSGIKVLENNFEVVDRESFGYRSGFSQKDSRPNTLDLSRLSFDFGR